MAVDGAVGNDAVIVIQMVEQLLAENTFPGSCDSVLSKRNSAGVKSSIFPAMTPENDFRRQSAGCLHPFVAVRAEVYNDAGSSSRERRLRAGCRVYKYNHPHQSPVPAGDQSLRFCGYHHDGNFRETPNFPTQGQAIGAGQHQIQQDQIGRRLTYVRQNQIAMADERRRVACRPQIVDKQLSQQVRLPRSEYAACFHQWVTLSYISL